MASFGIEMELLIKPLAETLPLVTKHGYRPENIPRLNMIAVHKALVEVLLERNFPAELYDEDSGYQSKWQVAADASIRSNGDFVGVEIISKILYINSEWTTEVDRFWGILIDNFEVRGDSSCGTHIHFSPNGGFTLLQLKALAKFTTIFQPAVTALIPAARRDTDWCHPNAEVVEGLKARYAAGRPVLFPWIENFPSKEVCSGVKYPRVK
ncbi:hypothetical protein MGYG_03446 [Nannizzia gypsea CBS 118893]|uniref:Amidoligase enzyme n=1 Tax=Arthroderma gypseum (strain ATCC MYA-4604 / CBS 118893) TaxID=535722 RepID=E4US26_ARTGP|nr:hypothetical protein MGYG_03446 [Nannizzia gypsea CBS 118893]EFR00444.1 hypothetical protein MGYG_03446 [Nannizzia gypsea CBS 118893]